MLEFAEKNDIILYCLPPHCTAYLQPLDRAFFKAFKGYYYQAARILQKSKPGQKIGRLQFGKLLGEAWGKSASVQNSLSAFKSTGIVPFNSSAIPDYAYLGVVSDTTGNRPDSLAKTDAISEPNPSIIFKENDISGSTPSTSRQDDHNVITPGKALDQISPVPVMSEKVLSVRKKILASSVLTSSEHIKFRKEKFLQQSKKQKIVEPKKKTKAKKSILNKLKSKKRSKSFSSSEEDLILSGSSDDENMSDYENECVGCGEDYRRTKKLEDWIKCLICGRWLHEGCTPFLNLCVLCSKHAAKKK